jgi:hypothetical protein
MRDTLASLASANIKYASKEERKNSLTASSNSTLGATYGMLWLDVEGSQVSYRAFTFLSNPYLLCLIPSFLFP